MTLIIGLRGINKSYLAADSRVTNIVTGDYADDVSKWTHFGPLASCVVAGNAYMAAYICNAIREKVGESPTFAEVRSIFDKDLESIARQFNQDTGLFYRCTIMLAGYRIDSMDSLDMGKIGEVMGAGVKEQGEGIPVNQSIDREIIKSVHYKFLISELVGRRTGIGVGERVNVNRPKSELIAYDIRLDQFGSGCHIDVTEADTYQALIFGADTAVNKLELPTESISNIYFRDMTGQNMQTIVGIDGIFFVAFINKTIKERGYTNVGGNVIPIYVTPNMHGFAAGIVGMIDPSTLEASTLNEFEVIGGKMHYKDNDGQFRPYRSLDDIIAGAVGSYQFEL